MSLESALHQIFSFTGTFDIKLIIVIFCICAIGEVWVGLPYLVETVWLTSGYNVISGTLSPFFLLLLWLVAQAGRQLGTFIIAKFGHLGSVPLMKFYRHLFKKNQPAGQQENNRPGGFLNIKDYLSPFSVALGRLMWLRLPIALTLGAARRFRTLALGVVISSVLWDGIYIALGMLGANRVLKPYQMVEYSLIGLTALYILTFLIRRLFRHYRRTRAS